MKIAIIIPAYNEEQFIGKTLDSLLAQTLLPEKIVVVDDNSTDRTAKIVESYDSEIIMLVKNQSENKSMPGAKIVRAFNKGLEHIDLALFDIICKFDADLIFPENYLDVIGSRFRESEKTGMAAGFCSIQKNDSWEVEGFTNEDHIRGALKAYRIKCFQQMGGLRTSIGWDTADEMIARYNGWDVVTVKELLVKHLKPTGSKYDSYAMNKQGEAFYKLGYDMGILLITAFKMAANKKKLGVFSAILKGYLDSRSNDVSHIVTKAQATFVRRYRWRQVCKKLKFS
ncbi:glycosyl transferase family 2 [Nonlabens spongiae]|uniref:Glycosyl transferase family 2 n=1 Tax=Nonlabens spongiae TaxID=331648 RepID=A0A1W6MI91_9FLAO|nr:glycosyltransferase family A protein [Nonlabens spongiae]ARN77216.1 glycosyl transferase family 2 [Nonlabens spongiae]